MYITYMHKICIEVDQGRSLLRKTDQNLKFVIKFDLEGHVTITWGENSKYLSRKSGPGLV